MRQDIAYGIIALMVVSIILIWVLSARKSRASRKGNLRIDLGRKDEE